MRQKSDLWRERADGPAIESDVCVVGAGFSGLAAARALHNRGLSFVCVESASEIGGVWRAAGEATPAYRSLHLNTSRHVTGYTGFPMPDSFPCYPGLKQVSGYLNSFADQGGLRPFVELDTEVVAIRQRHDHAWIVTTRHRVTGVERHRCFGHVVVAAGYHWEPKLPDIPGSDSFPGRCAHSFDYVDASEFGGKRVLVLGFGNSACDIAVESSRIAADTFLSVRRGAHVVPKQIMGIPIDQIASKRWWSWLPFRAQRRLIELLLWAVHGPVTLYGIPEPDHRIFSAPVTISDDLLSRIRHGAITPKPVIDHFDSSTVYFADGTHEEIDVVVYCTGYRFSFDFLPPDAVFAETGQAALYRRVVPPRHTHLYFVGLVRPVGAMTRLVENQSEWIADLIEGVATLPGTDEMSREIEAHLQRATKRYGTDAMDSIHVDFPTYLRALGEERVQGRRLGGRSHAPAHRSATEEAQPAGDTSRAGTHP